MAKKSATGKRTRRTASALRAVLNAAVKRQGRAAMVAGAGPDAGGARAARAARGAGAARAAAAATKIVTFTCSNPACLVGITSGTLNFAFVGSGAASFPVGNSPIFYRVQGPAKPVTITTQGGTLNPPIVGTPSFGGFTTVTVV